jgi:CheY-like chemotaxis protein
MTTVRRILLVEDEASFRRSVAAYLEDSGYQIFEAGNSEEGLMLFEREKPDIVVTDLRMPGMGGMALIDRLRASHPETPILVLTGTGDQFAQAAALEKGACECVLKPITDLAILEAAIERALVAA